MAKSKAAYLTLRNALKRAAMEASHEAMASERGNTDGQTVEEARKFRMKPAPQTLGTIFYQNLIDERRGFNQAEYEFLISDGVVLVDEVSLKPEATVYAGIGGRQ